MANEKEESGVGIDDYVIDQKIDAFCESYAPANSEAESDEYFTDGKLREYFQAYQRTVGDVLKGYMDALDNRGYRMRTHLSTNEPVIFVKRREEINKRLLQDIFGA